MPRFETTAKMGAARRSGRAMVLAVALAGCGDAGSSTSLEPIGPSEPSGIVDVTPHRNTDSFSRPEPDPQVAVVDQLCTLEPEREGCEVRRLELALDYTCGNCHGTLARRQGIGTGDGLYWIDDLEFLATTTKITSCDSAGSRLLQRVREGSMPPPNAGLPLDPATTDELSTFIDGMCDDLTGEGPGSAKRHAVEASLRDSCGSCHGAEAAAAGAIQGGLGEIENLLALVGAGQINRCGSKGSKLINRILDGSMPPRDAPNPPLTYEQLGDLASFIDRPCDYPATE